MNNIVNNQRQNQNQNENQKGEHGDPYFEFLALSPAAPLQRLESNPLTRGYSNVSVESDKGAHFVPFGRGHRDLANEPDALSKFTFNELNAQTLLNDRDEEEEINDDDGINCVTPVQSLLERARMQHPQHQPMTHLALLEDGDTDFDNKTDLSSQIASSQDKDEFGIQRNTNFNAEAQIFVPLPQPQPTFNQFVQTQAQAQPLNIYIPPPISMAMPPQNQHQHQPQPPNCTPHGQYVHQQQGTPHSHYSQQSRTPPHGHPGPHPLTPQQVTPNMTQRGYGWNNVNKNRGRARNNRFGGKQHDHQHQTQPSSVNLKKMEIPDIIKMSASLQDLLRNDMICKFMKHQNGSRYIQEKLKMADRRLRLSILKHIIFVENKILELSEDIFGNYVIQIFFEKNSAENMVCEQHDLLFNHLLSGNMEKLSRSFYGCRVIQKALDCIPRERSMELIGELAAAANNESIQINNDQVGSKHDQSVIHQCIVCPNANHVIQKIISLELDIEHIQFIIDCIDVNISFYSSHIFGCRIVQNIINFYGYHDNKRIIREMTGKDNLIALCQSQYGNYVIQHILKLSFADGQDQCLDIKQKVVRNVFSNVVFLSKNKFGSNVVEHCLEIANDSQRDAVLDQILSKKGKVLGEMVKHKFANYVVQKLLNYCNSAQQQRLIVAIERYVPNLRAINYGKHIMDKIKSIKMGKSSYTQSLSQHQHNQHRHSFNKGHKKNYY